MGSTSSGGTARARFQDELDEIGNPRQYWQAVGLSFDRATTAGDRASRRVRPWVGLPAIRAEFRPGGGSPGSFRSFFGILSLPVQLNHARIMVWRRFTLYARHTSFHSPLTCSFPARAAARASSLR